MQTVDLYDYLYVQTGGKGISLSGNLRYIPYNQSNLVYRAAEAFYQSAGLTPEVRIYLQKHIPIQAGMGGGSGNAAGILWGLNEIYGRPLDDKRLYDICLTLGSDVPYFLTGGTALCEGRGEIITPLADIPDCYFVLVKDKQGVSTKDAFADIDGCKNPPSFVCDAMLDAVEQGSMEGICRSLGNTFTPSARARSASIDANIREMMQFTDYVQMTGSGSVVFGIFTDKQQAKDCLEALRRRHLFVCMTRPVKTGMILLKKEQEE